MNQAPVFYRSFLPPLVSVLNSDYWTTVMEIYDAGKYRETIYAVLDYIQPGLSEKSEDTSRSRYVLPHGSITVTLEITDTEYRINAPFLRIPARSLIPLMRQVAEINFGTLVLAQIVIEDNDIYFRYEAPLELCEPFKLYRVLEEICIQADANDDVFIEKFGAQRFSTPDIEPFSQDTITDCHQKYHSFLAEVSTAIQYFESKRIEYFSWDMLYITLTRIDYYMRPQGFLKSEIEKAVRELNSSDPMPDKLTKGKKTLEKLQNYTMEKFTESMYRSKQFISEKPKHELTGVQSYLSKNYNTARDERSRRDFIGATLSMLVGFYGLLYYYHIPQPQYDLIIQALEQASSKPWSEAADILWDAHEQIMNQTNKPANPYGLRE